MSFLARRLLALLATLWAITIVVFVLLAALPGGVFGAYVDASGGSNPTVGAARGLTAFKPLPLQYVLWLSRVLRGDFGWSRTNAEPAATALAEWMPVTLELFCIAFVAAVALGMVLEYLRAFSRRAAARESVTALELLFRSMPVFLLGIFAPLLWALTSLVHLPFPAVVGAALVVPFAGWSSALMGHLRVAGDGAGTWLETWPRLVAALLAGIGPSLLAATILLEPSMIVQRGGRIWMQSVRELDSGLLTGGLLLYLTACALMLALSPSSARPPRAHRPTISRTRRRYVATALVVLGAAALLALGANVLAPDPNVIDQAHWQGYPLGPGTGGHLLGTDENGRDFLARLLFGLRNSLLVSVVATLVAAALAAIVAVVMNAVRRPAGEVFPLIGIRPFAAYPLLAVIEAIVIVDSAPDPSTIRALVLGIGLMIWPAAIPAFRAALADKSRAAALAAVAALGGGALMLDVTLEMAGFGPRPPAASLGAILRNAEPNLFVAPHVDIVPTVVIVLLLFVLYGLGDALRGTSQGDAPPR